MYIITDEFNQTLFDTEFVSYNEAEDYLVQFLEYTGENRGDFYIKQDNGQGFDLWN